MTDFDAGIVVALDVVAGHDLPTLGEEIMLAAGFDQIFAEVMRNGLPRTQSMAIAIRQGLRARGHSTHDGTQSGVKHDG